MEHFIKNQAELAKVNKLLLDDYIDAMKKSMDYLKEKDIDVNLKVGSLYVVKNLLLNKEMFDFEIIKSTIDRFIKYYQEEYKSYIDNLVIVSDQFYANLCFYDKFIKKEETKS